MPYSCIVSRLTEVKKHPNADRLQIAKCRGYHVVVGLDFNEGDIVLLFPEDGQLSVEYATSNNLIRKKDENGNNVGGMFDENRRVRTQRLRSEKSEAYIASLNSLAFVDNEWNLLKEGDTFTTYKKVPICNKYVNPSTRAARNSEGPSKARNKNYWNKYVKDYIREVFHEHTDTDNIRYLKLEQGQSYIATVTLKMHGTSQRSANLIVPDEKSHKWYHKLLKIPPKKAYQYLYGTRRVIRGEGKELKDYREICHESLRPYVRKGETWYYEIVGWEDTGKPIMQSVDFKKLSKHLTKDQWKQFKQYYGDGNVNWVYGLPHQTYKIYVYRIMVQDADGYTNELPWPVVKRRCELAGISHVPEIGVSQKYIEGSDGMQNIIDDFAEFVDTEDFTFHNCRGQSKTPHPDEGICIRFDGLSDGTSKIYKSKSFIFRVLEGIVKDSGAVDTEEAEGTIESS